MKVIGLITDTNTKKFYKHKFGSDLGSGINYHIYVTGKHPNGAGKYQIKAVNVNGKKIDISLDFKVGQFEAAAAVINQRVLFFRVKPNCEIVSIRTKFSDKKS